MDPFDRNPQALIAISPVFDKDYIVTRPGGGDHHREMILLRPIVIPSIYR